MSPLLQRRPLQSASSGFGISATPRRIKRYGSCRAGQLNWYSTLTRTSWDSMTRISLEPAKVFQAQFFQGRTRGHCSLIQGSTSWAYISSLAVRFASWDFLQVNSPIRMWIWKCFGENLHRICANNSAQLRIQTSTSAFWKWPSSLAWRMHWKTIEQSGPP